MDPDEPGDLEPIEDERPADATAAATTGRRPPPSWLQTALLALIAVGVVANAGVGVARLATAERPPSSPATRWVERAVPRVDPSPYAYTVDGELGPLTTAREYALRACSATIHGVERYEDETSAQDFARLRREADDAHAAAHLDPAYQALDEGMHQWLDEAAGVPSPADGGAALVSRECHRHFEAEARNAWDRTFATTPERVVPAD